MAQWTRGCSGGTGDTIAVLTVGNTLYSMVWYVYQLVDGSSQGRVSLQASQLDCECPEGQSGCLPNVPLSFPKDMGTPTRTRYMPLVMVRRNLYTYVGAKTFVIPLVRTSAAVPCSVDLICKFVSCWRSAKRGVHRAHAQLYRCRCHVLKRLRHSGGWERAVVPDQWRVPRHESGPVAARPRQRGRSPDRLVPPCH